MKAFITLLSSSDYLPGVLALQKSLMLVKSKYNLVCALTDDLIDLSPILKKYNIIVEIVPRLEYSTFIKKQYAESSVLNTCSKYNILNLKQYEKLIYIDCDCWIKKNIDELFLKPNKSIAIVDNLPMSCLFVFSPKTHDINQFLKYEDMLDGDVFISEYYWSSKSPYFQIPEIYAYPYYKLFQNDEIDQNIKVIHFVNKYYKKPWVDMENEYYQNKYIYPYLLLLQEINNDIQKI